MKHTPILHVALLLGGLMALTPPLAAEPRAERITLETLLQRHLRAAATPAAVRAKPEPEETVYAISAAGLTGTLTEYSAPPKKSRVEMALGPLRTVMADDGKVSWQQDPTGNVRVVQGAEQTERRAASSFSLETYDPIRDRKRGSVRLRPQREPGTGNYVLDLAPVGGTVQTLYLDPKTYLVRKMIARSGGLTQSVTIQEYRTMDGAKIPSRLTMGVPGLPLAIQATLVTARRGLTLPPTLFAPPQVAQDWTFLTPGANSATVAFAATDNEVVIPVVINGQTRHFLLDSGAGSSFITGSAAQALGLTTTSGFPAVGYGGAAKTGIVAKANQLTKTAMEIPGAVRLNGLALYVLSDPTIEQALTARGGVDGAIGYDLLQRLTVTFDYAQKQVTFTDPKTFTTSLASDTVTLPIKLELQTPTITASVDGKRPGRFLVDTGDSGAVHLFTQYATANGLAATEATPGAQVVSGVGIGGILREIITPGHQLTLGGQTLTSVPVATIPGEPGRFDIAGASSHAGGIGNLALRKFVVTFDYRRGHLLLQKPPEFSPALAPFAVPSPPLTPQTQAKPSASFFRLAAQVTASTPSLTTDEVLRRHLKALGGRDAVSAIKSTRVTSRVETGGIHGTIVSLYAAPDREYEEDKLGIEDIRQGFDGKQAWRADSNGNVRMLAGDELQNLRNQLFFDTNSYVIPGRVAGRVTLRPAREPGTGNYVLDVLPEGGKPAVLYLDPHTYLIAKESHRDDAVTQTTSFSGYKRVDGVLFPTVQKITNGSAQYDVTATATKVENNVAVSEALFAPPTLEKKFAFVTPGQSSVTVPFTFDNGQIALDLRVNGTKERMFLDTGSSGIALSLREAKALKLPQSGFLEARGYGGSQNLYPVHLDSLELPGAVRLTNVNAMAVPLPESLDRVLGGSIAGFIGYDLLAQCVVKLDFPKRQITFTDPAAFQPSAADGTPLPVDLDNNIPSVKAQLDAYSPTRFLLDTGDGTAIRLYGPFIAAHGLDKKYPHGLEVSGGGIGGVSRSRLTQVGSFTIAGLTIRDVPTDFSLDTKGGASQVNAGSVGTGLLSRFVVTLDYPHSRIFFAPTPGATQTFGVRSTGIIIAPSADKAGNLRIMVASVLPTAPAAQDGLTPNSEILTIDGKPAAALGLEAVAALLRGQGSEPVHILRVQPPQGEPRTIRATLYNPLQ